MGKEENHFHYGVIVTEDQQLPLHNDRANISPSNQSFWFSVIANQIQTFIITG